MTYTTNDGEVLQAVDALQVVERLRSTAIFPTPSTEEYMVEVSARAFLQNGSIVRTDTAEHFVADLLGGRLLVPVSMN
jgi:hypothetical protein